MEARQRARCCGTRESERPAGEGVVSTEKNRKTQSTSAARTTQETTQTHKDQGAAEPTGGHTFIRAARSFSGRRRARFLAVPCAVVSPDRYEGAHEADQRGGLLPRLIAQRREVRHADDSVAVDDPRHGPSLEGRRAARAGEIGLDRSDLGQGCVCCLLPEIREFFVTQGSGPHRGRTEF